MTTKAITPLRQRMIEDMNARKLCVGTRRGHIRACKRFAGAKAIILCTGSQFIKPINIADACIGRQD
jgi:hypothetical protein